MSQATTVIERYFDAFNSHDVEGVMACFDTQAVIVASHGRRIEGAEEIRTYYMGAFATFHDAKCTIRTLVGDDGTGAVESLFTGTREGMPQPMQMLGVEVIDVRDGKITELRDYHTPA